MSAPLYVGKSPVILNAVGQRIPFRVKLGSIKLATSGSLSGDRCLVIDGVTGQKVFESTLTGFANQTDELHLPTHTAIYENLEVSQIPSGTAYIFVYYE